QRLLAAQAKADTVGALIKLLDDKAVDETGHNAGAVHALRTLQAIGALDGSNEAAAKAAVAAVSHPAAPVRATALGVLPRQDKWFAQLPAALYAESDSKVRLACLLALADLPAGEAGGAQVAACVTGKGYTEYGLQTALTAAASTHDRFFLAKVAQLP